jgi:hypothetical protein
MSTHVLRTSGIADYLALQIAQHAIQALQGETASAFLFNSLDLDGIAYQGAHRTYKAAFQSLVNRTQRIAITLYIWKDYRLSTGASDRPDVLETSANWKNILVVLIDENDQWRYVLPGQITWQKDIPIIRYEPLQDKRPSKNWLERETRKGNTWWQEDRGIRTAVFCPDKSQTSRIVVLGNQPLAETYIRLTDPDGLLGRRLSFPNACVYCGSEFDATGECGNECSVYART